MYGQMDRCIDWITKIKVLISLIGVEKWFLDRMSDWENDVGRPDWWWRENRFRF